MDGASEAALAQARAFEAREADNEFLKERRLAGGAPKTKAALRSSREYVCGSDLKDGEILRPGAKPVELVAGSQVYLRSDIVHSSKYTGSALPADRTQN